MGVGRRKDVSAPGIVGVRNAQLCKQGSSHVALVHNLVYAHTSLAECTTAPDHGDVEIVGVFITAMEHAAMVGDEHHEQVVPHLRDGLETVHQAAYCRIGVGEDIQCVVLQGA